MTIDIATQDGTETIEVCRTAVAGIVAHEGERSNTWHLTHKRSGRWVAFGLGCLDVAKHVAEVAEDKAGPSEWGALRDVRRRSLPLWAWEWQAAAMKATR